MSNRVKLGKTDLYVNPIGIGANAVGGHNLYPDLNEEAGRDVIRTAIAQGANFIDTAFSYGYGRSEELIGEVIEEMKNRSEVVIATKGAQRKEGDSYVTDNSPDFLRKSVEGSLKSLRTDYIDLFYIHFPDDNTPKDEAVGALQRLKEEGKIRAIGVSNFSADQLKEANKDGYVEVFQGGYNLIDRQAEKDYFPYMREHRISFIPYFPLASGLLAGKYSTKTKFNDFRANMPHLQGEEFEKNLERVEKVRSIANAKGADVAHIVLAWYLAQDCIDAVIPGAKRAEQVLDNLNTLEVSLTQEEIDEIDSIFR